MTSKVEVRGRDMERMRIYVGGEPPEEVLLSISHGFTMYSTDGAWEGLWERSTVIEIIMDPGETVNLDALASWAHGEGEEALLVTTEVVQGLVLPLQDKSLKGAAPSDAVPAIGEGRW